jgi:hypothetical protein
MRIERLNDDRRNCHDTPARFALGLEEHPTVARDFLRLGVP